MKYFLFRATLIDHYLDPASYKNIYGNDYNPTLQTSTVLSSSVYPAKPPLWSTFTLEEVRVDHSFSVFVIMILFQTFIFECHPNINAY